MRRVVAAGFLVSSLCLGAAAEPPRPATNQSGTSWKSGTYQYDGAGNVYAIGTVANPNGDGVYTTYSYDAMSRLAAVNSTARNETYAYDVYGNMTRATARDGSRIDYSVNTANQLSGAGITYDAAGSLKTYGGETYWYDALGMVVSKDHDNTWHDLYVYTADGERIGAKVGDTWTWTLRDDAHNVLRQYQSSYTTPSQSWTWLEDYEYGPRGLVSGQRSSADGGLRHFHLDHLGSIRLITSAYGVAVSQHDFSPFGLELTPQHQEATRDDPKQFTGHERDVLPSQLPNPERALDYMHARYYGAAMGRFLAVDPARESAHPEMPQSWNRYTYVMGNPLKLLDPSGEVWVPDGIGGWAWQDECGDNFVCHDSVAAQIDANTVRVYGPDSADDVCDYFTNANGYINLTSLDQDEDYYTVKSGAAPYASPRNAAAFYNVAEEYHENHENDEPLLVTDAGRADGATLPPHSTHDHGRAIDFRYMDSNGRPVHGLNAINFADDQRMRTLLGLAAANGFNQNYTDNNIDYGTLWAAGHSSHAHIGTTRR